MKKNLIKHSFRQFWSVFFCSLGVYALSSVLCLTAIAQDLVFKNAIVTLAASEIYVKGNCTIIGNQASEINLAKPLHLFGNLSHQADQSWILRGDAPIQFNGLQDQWIAGNQIIPFFQILVNKPQGKLILKQNIIVSDTLFMKMGHVEIGLNQIALGKTGVLSGEKEQARVYGTTGFVSAEARIDDGKGFQDPTGLGLSMYPLSQGSFPLQIERRNILNQAGQGSLSRTYTLIPTIGGLPFMRFDFHYFNAELLPQHTNLKAYQQSQGDLFWIPKQVQSVSTSQSHQDTLLATTKSYKLTLAAAVCAQKTGIDYTPQPVVCGDTLKLPKQAFCLYSSTSGPLDQNLRDLIFTTAQTLALQKTDTMGCVNTKLLNIIVGVVPKAKFQFPYTACMYHPLDITNSSIGAIKQRWQWNSKSISSSIQPNIIPNVMGLQKLSLIVESQQGCEDSVSQNTLIYDLPKPQFSMSDTCAGHLVQIKDLSTYPNLNGQDAGIKKYDWYWKGTNVYAWNAFNPNLAQNPVPVRPYISGTYPMKLVLETFAGCKDSVLKLFESRLNGPLDSACIFPLSFELGKPFYLCDSSQTIHFQGKNKQAQWIWTLNGKVISTFPNCVVSDTGKLIAIAIRGIQSWTDTVQIAQSPQKIDVQFLMASTAQPNDTIYPIITLATHAQNYHWYFGTESIDTSFSSYHVFRQIGKYAIVLRAQNAFCEDTMVKWVDIQWLRQGTVEIKPKENARMSLYPNPVLTDKTFWIQLENNSKGWLRIYSLDGKLCLKKEFFDPGTEKISMHLYPSGLYTVHWTEATETLVSKILLP